MPTFKALGAAQSAQLLKVIAVLVLLLLAAIGAIGWLAWSLFDQGRDHAAALAKSQTEHSEQLRVCGEVNDGVNSAVDDLTEKLVECRGESQDIERRLSRAISLRKEAEERLARAARADLDGLNRLLESHDACRDRPVCRPLSDELRRRWAESSTD
jgi:hypothetical protein